MLGTEAGRLAGSVVVGALVGALIAVVLLALLRMVGRSSPLAVRTFRRVRVSASVTAVLAGAWAGLVLGGGGDDFAWFAPVRHLMLMTIIASAGWLVYTALGMLQDAALLTNPRTGRDARRFRTQAAVLRRTLQATTVFLTVLLMLLTFPEARAPMASLLASAGLLSVVLGIAAQSTLGNMLAGLQLAFSDALRVGDVVVVGNDTQPGTVEELTLTYIVVRTWDERRLLLPSTEFTTKPFQNWTRRASKLLGTVDLTLDWAAPVAQIRAEVERLLFATDLWDRRTWTAQVYALSGQYMTMRITVSAPDWPKLWDLRSYLRENLLAWIEANAPWAVPRQRYLREPRGEGRSQWPTDEVVQDKLDGPTFTGPLGGGYMRAEQQEVIKAKLPKEEVAEVAADDAADSHSRVLPLDRLPGREDPYDHPIPAPFKNLGKGDMLFSGTADGEERAKRYEGPGEEVIEGREQRAAQSDADAQAPLPDDVAKAPLPEGSAQPQAQARPLTNPASAKQGRAAETEGRAADAATQASASQNTSEPATGGGNQAPTS